MTKEQKFLVFGVFFFMVQIIAVPMIIKHTIEFNQECKKPKVLVPTKYEKCLESEHSKCILVNKGVPGIDIWCKEASKIPCRRFLKSN